MTTWENIDNIDYDENVTVTSDAAYERVTSDEHFEEERNWGFLQQNTSWLVQEIPNISFLDIADTLLENKKTLYNRKNWNIVIGTAGRSIEAQPQDLARLVSDEYEYDATASTFTIPFDDIEIPSGEDELNIKTFEFENNWVKVLIPWVYRISYWWQMSPWTNTNAFSVWLFLNNNYITSDNYSDTNWFWRMSWWRSISLRCEAWDILTLHSYTVWWTAKVYLTSNNTRFTYLEIQYIQQVL